MDLALLELWHSRPIAPTRRVALGDSVLPTSPAPGPGGLLLGAVAARFADDLDKDLVEEMRELMSDVERGRKIGQPRLRHRLQKDRVGLLRCRHRLVAAPEGLRFVLETANGLPAQSVLAAIYEVEGLAREHRKPVLDVMRKGLEWHGAIGPGVIDHLVGRDVAMRLRSGEFSVASDPMQWALQILELDRNLQPDPKVVQRSYRKLLRTAHPDHGAGEEGAADRIAELAKARDILLS